MTPEEIQTVLDDAAERLGRIDARLDAMSNKTGAIADQWCKDGAHGQSANLRQAQAEIVTARAAVLRAIAYGRCVKNDGIQPLSGGK